MLNNNVLAKHVVAVFVFITNGDEVLLVRQNYGLKYWSLPGGVVEKGETLDQAAVRELKEETGLDIRLNRVVGLYSKPSEDAIAITFAGEVIGGELKEDNEIIECRFFHPDHLPMPVRGHLQERIDDYRKGSQSVFIKSQ
jgi:ADP-ribose pyrophosphatase YjhB (NUDIX family)